MTLGDGRKKMHFLLTTQKVVYVLTTPMPKLLEDATVEAIRIRAKWENDDYICRGHIECHLRIEESLKAQDSDKGKGKEVGGPSANMTEEGGKNKHHTQNKGKKRSNENNSGSSSNKKPKLECWKCGKSGHFKRDCRSGKKNNANAGGSRKGSKDQSQDEDSGAITYVCKDCCWFKTYEPVKDGFVLYMGDDNFAHVHGKGSVALEFSSGETITLFNVLYVPKLHSVYMSSSTIVKSSLWHAHLGHVHYKRMLEMSKNNLIPAIDENTEKCTTSLYTPHQIGVAKRKNRALKEMVNSMLSYSGLSEGFWGEAMLTDCYLLNRVPNKINKTTPYELWYKKRLSLVFLRVWGCRAVVRLLGPKRKTLGEKGIDCIFVGYAEHSKAYRFYITKPNKSVFINSIIESRDAIFDENRFSSIPSPKDIIPNSDESLRDDHSNDVPNEILEPRKEAIDDEIGSIMENNTWVLSNLPPGCKPLGFRQKEGIDYFDTSAPVARITTIRLLLALAAIHNLVIHQMDVKIAFLNGDLEEEVYMKQPKGFVMPGTRPDIAYVVGRLSKFTSNPSRQHWKAITIVFKYLRGTMNYGLSFVGYPSVLEAYSDAS
nr:zinc finger, CCHC-type [Tanacetum cinerariifolium]